MPISLAYFFMYVFKVFKISQVTIYLLLHFTKIPSYHIFCDIPPLKKLLEIFIVKNFFLLFSVVPVNLQGFCTVILHGLRLPLSWIGSTISWSFVFLLLRFLPKCTGAHPSAVYKERVHKSYFFLSLLSLQILFYLHTISNVAECKT